MISHIDNHIMDADETDEIVQVSVDLTQGVDL